MFTYFFLFITFVFALLSVYRNKKEEYVKLISITISFFLVIHALIIDFYYPQFDTLFIVSLITSILSFIVYLISQSDVKW